ncbi:ABC transporter permease [Gordonia sp. TBRC 11910]|uniref:ABC transporter permease n=1 Tax=Gordonia asplenii TaxID=2725283 RepID=A0A848L3X2_9ACTN|nr:ABC transporter permease [Gordonia asplenii]NMO03293.1 ABC transporter permease [Gordonia asplenii]
MTTITRRRPTTVHETTPTPAPTNRSTTFRRVLRSERLKLTTLTSTWVTLASVFASLVGIAVISAAATSTSAQSTDTVAVVLNGSMLAMLIVGVFGVVTGSREFSTSMIRTTLAAVPTRLPVLWAKFAAFIAFVLPTSAAATVIAYLAGSVVLQSKAVDIASLTDPSAIRAVLGTALYITGVGVIGIALGVLLRSLGAAIGMLTATLIVVPVIAKVLLPHSWSSALNYLPSNAAASFTTFAPTSSQLSPTTGAVVFASWTAIGVIGAAVALRVRDV